MKVVDKIMSMTKIVLHAHRIINKLQSIGLEVEPSGDGNIGDSLYSIITDSTSIIMDETNLSKAENFDDIQETIDSMLANHKNITDLSELEAFYMQKSVNIKMNPQPVNEPKMMPVKYYNSTFLPMIDRARGFIDRFELIIDHMDKEKVDHDEVRRLFNLYGLNDELKEFIVTALEYYKQRNGLDCLSEFSDVKLDFHENLMYCPHCHTHIGTAHDWTPNYCPECGKPLTGGNGRGN